jgi:hypothetical protein
MRGGRAYTLQCEVYLSSSMAVKKVGKEVRGVRRREIVESGVAEQARAEGVGLYCLSICVYTYGLP